MDKLKGSLTARYANAQWGRPTHLFPDGKYIVATWRNPKGIDTTGLTNPVLTIWFTMPHMVMTDYALRERIR